MDTWNSNLSLASCFNGLWGRTADSDQAEGAFYFPVFNRVLGETADIYRFIHRFAYAYGGIRHRVVQEQY